MFFDRQKFDQSGSRSAVGLLINPVAQRLAAIQPRVQQMALARLSSINGAKQKNQKIETRFSQKSTHFILHFANADMICLKLIQSAPSQHGNALNDFLIGD